jgi:hypothetical protein
MASKEDPLDRGALCAMGNATGAFSPPRPPFGRLGSLPAFSPTFETPSEKFDQWIAEHEAQKNVRKIEAPAVSRCREQARTGRTTALVPMP